MSGIYIPGMEMPKEGARAFTIIFSDGKAAISVEPFEWHEVIPVPDHGRLIEAEPIQKYITDGLNSGEFGYDQIKVLAEIQYAPTVISADKEEKP